MPRTTNRILTLAFVLALPFTALAQIDHEAELRATAEKLIAAMEIRDVEAVLALSSKNGVSVGTDAPVMKFSDFAKSLKKKSQIYCALMDDGCIENRRDNALIDSLHNKPALRIKPIKDKPNGAIVLSNYGRHESELHFAFEDGAWKFISAEWN